MLYVEDILTKVIDYYPADMIPDGDRLILESFKSKIDKQEELTRKQGNLLLKLLNLHAPSFSTVGFDYEENVKNPVWRTKFRALDLTRKIYVKTDTDGYLCIYLKFPYQLKDSFEKEITGHRGVWDRESKSHKLSLNKSNILQVNEFAIQHGFVIDESFSQLMSSVEEILSQQENIIPFSDIINNKVEIFNSSPEVKEWWENNRTGNIYNDLLLSKSMGYVLSKMPLNIIEKIASFEETNFWTSSITDFFDIVSKIDGTVVIILDRAHNSLNWMKEFTKKAHEFGIPANDIKVCFRNDKVTDNGTNQWIKESGYGGKVDGGKLLIFNHKPAKWIFKNQLDIKIVATNNIYPPSDPVTRDWISNHPCVLYIGSVRPSKSKDTKIVDL